MTDEFSRSTAGMLLASETPKKRQGGNRVEREQKKKKNKRSYSGNPKVKKKKVILYMNEGAPHLPPPQIHIVVFCTHSGIPIATRTAFQKHIPFIYCIYIYIASLCSLSCLWFPIRHSIFIFFWTQCKKQHHPLALWCASSPPTGRGVLQLLPCSAVPVDR